MCDSGGDACYHLYRLQEVAYEGCTYRKAESVVVHIENDIRDKKGKGTSNITAGGQRAIANYANRSLPALFVYFFLYYR